jgi:hypothetical protein
LVKEVFNAVRLSSFFAMVLKYFAMIFLYLFLARAADKRQTSIPSCVVSDKNGEYTPSIKTIL